MNERFKFRVWNPDMESYDDDPQYNVDIKIDQENGLVLTPFHNNIIEFCTGLKDKNGNLIYEGDLIKSPNNSYPLEIVRMPNGVYGCKVCKISPVWEMNLYSLINAYDVEIIGNIHETKEK